MQMFTVLFAMLASIFGTIGKSAKTIEIVVEQTSYGLVKSRDMAAKDLMDYRKESSITQEDINKLNADIFG